jgi:hypothetical protein
VRLIVRTEAETDIARGFLWYENQRDGLGREFLQEISSRLAAIEQEPLRFPRVAGAEGKGVRFICRCRQVAGPRPFST